MESLEIAHKLLQLITRTLIQMITLKFGILSSLFYFLSISFSWACLCVLVHACASFCVYKCALALCVLCVCVCVTEGAACWGRARGLVHPGERTGPKPHLRPFLPSLLPHPVLSWDVSVGDGFPGNESPVRRLHCALRGWCRTVCCRWRGRGAQSDIGWNRRTSYTSKVNNFQPLLTTWLCFFFFPPSR